MSASLCEFTTPTNHQDNELAARIAFGCIHCGTRLSAVRNLAGTSGTCPGCRQRVTVPPAPRSLPPRRIASPPIACKVGSPNSHSSRGRRHALHLIAAGAGVALSVIAVLASGDIGDAVARMRPLLSYVTTDVERNSTRPTNETSVDDETANFETVRTNTPLDSEVSEPSPQPSLSIARQAKQVLTKHCYACHGEKGKAEGGFNFVLAVPKLLEGSHYVVPGDPAGSYLFDRVADRQMPPREEGESLSDLEIETLRQWILAGAPNFNEQQPRKFVRFDDMFLAMSIDLERTQQRDRRFIRYFSLTHLYNAGDSNDELQTYRSALTKLLNSLSRGERIIIPKPIDAEQTLFKIDLRDLDWTRDTWGKLIDASPYAMVFNSPSASMVYERTGTTVPLIRGDWLVAAASKPPLYHEILRLPETLDGLLSELGVDVTRNLKEDRALRIGFNRSGVSQNNRLIERHELLAGGYVWISYDFGSNTGRQNLLSHPLGPGSDERLFSHDGGEIIFSLPNGLQAYMLVDSDGKRINVGPTNIVSDPRRPDRLVTNGISCISCHYGGIIPKGDEVREHVQQHRDAFAADFAAVVALYQLPAITESIQARDAKRFRDALQTIGVERITPSNEPIFNISSRFEGELDAKLAAAELGLTVEELSNQLARHEGLARILGVVTSPGGVIKRDAFLELFKTAAERFRVGVPFRPTTKDREPPSPPLTQDKPTPSPLGLPNQVLPATTPVGATEDPNPVDSQTATPTPPATHDCPDYRKAGYGSPLSRANIRFVSTAHTEIEESVSVPRYVAAVESRRWATFSHPKLYGRLIALNDGHFYIACGDGTVIQGPVSDLSSTDLMYIERLIRL